MTMKKWTRARYQPNLPLHGENRVTASPAHIALSRQAAQEAGQQHLLSIYFQFPEIGNITSGGRCLGGVLYSQYPVFPICEHTLPLVTVYK